MAPRRGAVHDGVCDRLAHCHTHAVKRILIQTGGATKVVADNVDEVEHVDLALEVEANGVSVEHWANLFYESDDAQSRASAKHDFSCSGQMSGDRECAQNIPGERTVESGGSAVHIKGDCNSIADSISRRPAPDALLERRVARSR